MPDAEVKERFRSLDRVPAPDLWTDIETRNPADVSLGIAWPRIAVAALAFVVAAAGVSVAVRAFVLEGPRQVIAPVPIIPKANGKIAFVGGEQPGSPFGQPSHIFVVGASGSDLAQVTRGPGSDIEPAWSPDGQRIAFVRRGGEFPPNDIYTVNVDGSGLRKLTSVSQYQQSPSWSPDGNRIVFSRGGDNTDYDIYEMDSDGTDVVQLTTEKGNEWSPAWSPDGGHIAYVASPERNSGLTDLFVMRADGSDVWQLTSTGATEENPVWSPDGCRIAFLQEGGGRDPRITAIDADNSGCPRRDSPSGSIFLCRRSCESLLGLAWSPDGKRIAFSVERRIGGGKVRAEIDMVKVDGSGLEKLKTGGIPACCPSWQPIPIRRPEPPHTGQAVANGEIWFRRGGGDGPSYVYEIQPDGSGETLLFADDRDPNAPPDKVFPAVVGEEYDWTADGSRLVFSKGGVFSENQQAPMSWELFVMSPDGKTADQVTDDNGLASFPSWSPDGTRIVYSSARGRDLIAGCEGTTLCPSDIYVVNGDGAGQVRLTDDPADDSAPDWSPDGSKIVFRSTRDDDRGEIYVMNADGSGVVRLTSDPAITKQRPVWSPDGTQVAFIGNTQVYVMAADGSGLTKLTDVQGNSSIDDLTWSPDGTELAFSTDSGGDEPALFVMGSDGGNLRRLTGGGIGDIAWRPAEG